jgi:predicted transporter
MIPITKKYILRTYKKEEMKKMVINIITALAGIGFGGAVLYNYKKSKDEGEDVSKKTFIVGGLCLVGSVYLLIHNFL